MAKLIHVMVRVCDLDRSIAFYRVAFGLEVAERFDFDGFTLVYLRNDGTDVEVELTWNADRTTDYALGDGYGHLAFAVDDLESEHRRFVEAGLAPRDIVAFQPGGKLLARFFFVQDPDGYQIEVLQRHGRYG
ncbi:MAG: VOC family protein [Pseudomonadota bacterium]